MLLLIGCSIITFSGQTQRERWAVHVPSGGACACKCAPESNGQLRGMDQHLHKGQY
jgi:hypothetical protein